MAIRPVVSEILGRYNTPSPITYTPMAKNLPETIGILGGLNPAPLVSEKIGKYYANDFFISFLKVTSYRGLSRNRYWMDDDTFFFIFSRTLYF